MLFRFVSGVSLSTEEALEEGLLREDAEGKLTCKCCDTKVVSWRQHSVSEKHQRNEKYKQEKHNEEKKRKEKEEEKESQEITIEEALLKGIIKVDENRRIACVICKTQVVGWIQHRRSEQHKKEENKQKEETDKEVERLGVTNRRTRPRKKRVTRRERR